MAKQQLEEDDEEESIVPSPIIEEPEPIRRTQTNYQVIPYGRTTEAMSLILQAEQLGLRWAIDHDHLEVILAFSDDALHEGMLEHLGLVYVEDIVDKDVHFWSQVVDDDGLLVINNFPQPYEIVEVMIPVGDPEDQARQQFGYYDPKALEGGMPFVVFCYVGGGYTQHQTSIVAWRPIRTRLPQVSRSTTGR